MKPKSKLSGILINIIYNKVDSEEVREEIYNEFIEELLLQEYEDISFLDDCTEDDVFWDCMRAVGICDDSDDEIESETDDDLSIINDLDESDDSSREDLNFSNYETENSEDD
jgi:hypothetical protein